MRTMKRGSISSMAIGLLIVGLVIGAAGGYFFSTSSLQPQIDDLENQVSSLNTEVATLDTEVSALEEEKSDLESQVLELDTQVAELNSEKSSLEAELATAQAAIDANENEISSLQKTVAEYEDQIENLTTQLEIYVATPGYKKFSIYGLSFEYPEGYTTSLSGLLESTATQNSGLVMAQSIEESELYQIGWMYTLITPDLDMGIEGGISELEQFNVKLGTRETSELNGHVMRYQNYSFTAAGVKFYGVIATSYCTISDKFLMLQIALEENPDVFPIFWQFIDSITCH